MYILRKTLSDRSYQGTERQSYDFAQPVYRLRHLY